MKTLVKPLVKLNAEISFNQPYEQNKLYSNSFQHKKFNIKWKFLLIVMSFFTFIVFSDSPEVDADICNRFNNEKACNVW